MFSPFGANEPHVTGRTCTCTGDGGTCFVRRIFFESLVMPSICRMDRRSKLSLLWITHFSFFTPTWYSLYLYQVPTKETYNLLLSQLTHQPHTVQVQVFICHRFTVSPLIHSTQSVHTSKTQCQPSPPNACTTTSTLPVPLCFT